MLNPEQITELMLAHTLGPQAHQLTQTQYRFKIAELMNLKPGAQILEIGCGQGDMTAVLANQVGPTGKVVAVDPADPSYGSPFTLAESTNHFKTSALGPRIDFHLHQDPLEPGFLAAHGPFEAAVLAHCIWYFPNRETIHKTLTSLISYTPKLIIAEWLLEENDPYQRLHYLAATLQGKAAPLISCCEANIQTPLNYTELLNLIDSAGWNIQSQTQLDTAALPDARWEIDCALALIDESRDPLPIDTHSPESIFAPLRNPALVPTALPLPAILITATHRK